MKYIHWITALFLTLIPTAFSAQNHGVVFDVSKQKMEILVASGEMPSIGMYANISDPTDKTKIIASWVITKVEDNMVFAKPGSTPGQPKLGQAISFSKTPPTIASKKVPAAPPSKAPTPVTNNQNKNERSTPKTTTSTTGLNKQEQAYLTDLKSGDWPRIRNVAKHLYRKHSNNPILFGTAANLLQQSAPKATTRIQVDALSWICKALWVSGDQQYAPVLKQVGQTAKSRKLKKFAQKYYQAFLRKQ